MEINQIAFHNNKICNQKQNSIPKNYNVAKPKLDVSIYNQKGLNLPFCGLAKGLDEAEEACIYMLRKVREGRMRKYPENEIKEIITSLRQIKNPEDKKAVLEEIFEVKDEYQGKKLEKDLIKKIIDINANRPENQRYAVLEFAQNEISNSTKPMNSFSKLPKEVQDKLIPILEDIESINERKLFKSTKVQNEIINNLYEEFRVPVYAHEDLNILQGQKAIDYKIENAKMLNSDKKYINNLDGYANKTSKEKINTILEKIFNYYMENIL